MRQATPFLLLILAFGLAQAQDVPKRKSGLWEIKTTTLRSEGKPRAMQMCIDEKTDNAVRQLAGMRNEKCKTEKPRRDGDKLIVDGVCELSPKKTATTHAVITGNFDSAYKIESTSTYQPAVRGKTEGSAMLEARWLGPCEKDQRPGDVILASGKKFNVNDESSDEAPGKSKARARHKDADSAPIQKGRSVPPTQ